MTPGHLYVLLNAAMPGYAKLGGSERTAEDRARELSANSGVPTPYVVAYDEPVSDVWVAEKKLKAELAHLRVRKEREHFWIETKLAIQVVKRVAEQFRVPDHVLSAAQAVPNATVEVVGIPDEVDEVFIENSWWKVPLAGREVDEPVPAGLRRDLGRDELWGRLEKRIAELEDAFNNAMLELDRAERIPSYASGDEKALLVAQCHALDDARRTLQARLDSNLAGDDPLDDLYDLGPECWYYNHRVYRVTGEAVLTRDEESILVKHYAESGRSQFQRLAEEAKALKSARAEAPAPRPPRGSAPEVERNLGAIFKFTALVTREQDQRLTSLASRLEASKTQLVREGIDMVLAHYDQVTQSATGHIGREPARERSDLDRARHVELEVHLTPNQAQRLRALTCRVNIPLGVYVREGVDLLLRHRGG
ncbi:MAG: ribbon-helix-helix domain-containing protein [Myxococcales bacterium]|nr:ribbon-helix-helix domain-containing protein [Myxococcales bacterium]